VESLTTVDFSHEAMATTFEIAVAHNDRIYARQAASAAFAELDVLQQHLSRFIEGSDLWRLNHLGVESGPLAPATIECLRLACEAQRQTGGAFDICYGQSFDLGGIGKGFALDRMAAILAEWDIASALLSASRSTLLALGPPPDREGWPVCFGPPENPRRIHLAYRAVGGSGTAVQGHHIIDPRTGRPATHRFRAWALAPTAAMADVISTALMVMDDAEIADFCRRRPELEVFVLNEPNGHLTEPSSHET
jgi:thiamine biosynthesis lipoprotein